MTDDEKLMQQALEALSAMLTHMGMDEDEWNKLTFDQCRKAEADLRERLAQPEQEPVARAWDEGYRQGVEDECISAANIGIAGFGAKVKPARQNPYGITPPQRKPLTDEELEQVFPAIATYHEANKTLYRSIARAIEAAHGIKENT